jgi:TonB family protein
VQHPAVAYLFLVRSMARVSLFSLLIILVTLTREASAEPAGRQLCTYAPLPEYPAEARARDLAGNGVFVLHLNRKAGTVTSVTVEKSTGFAILDNAAIASLKRWRFIKNIDVPMVKVPFTFTTHGIPPDWKIVE